MIVSEQYRVIIAHLDKHGYTPLSELAQSIPRLSRMTIQRRLDEMADDPMTTHAMGYRIKVENGRPRLYCAVTIDKPAQSGETATELTYGALLAILTDRLKAGERLNEVMAMVRERDEEIAALKAKLNHMREMLA